MVKEERAMSTTATSTKQEIWNVLHSVYDPEIPVISVVDLGMIREVRTDGERVEVDVAPTYSGCPAMDVIPILIRQALLAEGFQEVLVRNVISPPWTTDWITDEGKRRLEAFGIAPPVGRADADREEDVDKEIPCPHCGSTDTVEVSRFGSTPCKAAYKCKACLEPFDYFKCH